MININENSKLIVLKFNKVEYFNLVARNLISIKIVASGKIFIFINVYAFMDKFKHLASTCGK